MTTIKYIIKGPMLKDSAEDIVERLFGPDSPIPSKVVTVETEPAVGELDNFLSEMTRMRVTTEGQPGQLSLIIKRMTEVIPISTNNISQKECFETEIATYSYVFKEIEKMLKSKCPSEKLLWPECIHHFNGNTIILEDLKTKRYEMADKIKGLNLEEAELSLAALAKIHAWSKVLIDGGQLSGFKPDTPICARDLKFFKDYFTAGLEQLSSHMATRMGPEWAPVAEKVKGFIDTFENDLSSLSRNKRGKFDVFNLGDCWCNNILFRRDESNKPVSVVFVDFQMTFVNSFAWDLLFFLFVNIPPSLRYPNLGRLISVYGRAFGQAWLSSGGRGPPPDEGVFSGDLDAFLLPSFLYAVVGFIEFANARPDDYKRELSEFFLPEWYEKCRGEILRDLEYFKSKGLL